MAHASQERYSALVDAKLRATLVTRDNTIFNNRYEGSPKAGKVKIPVRDTEVAVKAYDKANGVDADAGTTTYLDLDIDNDEAVNEIIDGFDAAVGGAKFSQHCYGKAADIRVQGVRVEDVAAYAESLLPDSGGVGRYPIRLGRTTGWVHVDVRKTKARWTG